jgi:hypothetical protein
LKILPVTQPFRRAPVGIVTLKNRTITPLAQLFIDEASGLAKQLTLAPPRSR